MNAVIRWEPSKVWNPLKEMMDLQNRMASIFNLTPFSGGEDKKETMTVTEWAPLVDIAEDDKEYLIKVELPEVKKEAVSVTVENGVLTIAGERQGEKEEKNIKYHRIERAYGRFVRSFTVPEDADEAKVTADFKDGVLKVHLAKTEKAKPKSIAVTVE